MCSAPKIRSRWAFPVLSFVLSFKVASAQQTALSPDEPIAVAITVKATNSVAQTEADEFLAGFITTAGRLEGQKFISCVTTATKLRPDLAARIAVSALNIAHLNSRLPGGHLSCGTIDQIVKAAVTAAPQNAASIVKAAIKSEPYARSCIVAAAIAAAPEQEAEIEAAANETQTMSILPTAGRFNPADNTPFEEVTSPEQPPPGP